MGHRSEELKDLIKKAEEKDKAPGPKPTRKIGVKKVVGPQEFPVENVDYWVLRQERGTMCPPGYIHYSVTRSQITKSVIKMVFENLKSGMRKPASSRDFWTQTWLVYPGPKPDKKWGPRVP